MARQALAAHIEKLILTPKLTPEGPIFELFGDADFLGGDQGVMLLGQGRNRTADASLFRATSTALGCR
jgi:hypothetical protein